MDELITCNHCGQQFSKSLFECHKCDTDDMDHYKMTSPHTEPLKALDKESKAFIDERVMESLYRIMCGTPIDFNGTQFQVSDEARKDMRRTHKFIIAWGRFYKVDMNG
jgi:hypothetical protein